MTVLDVATCSCGQPATRTLGAIPYCDPCAEAVLAPIRAKHPSNGQQTGPLRPDYGPGWAELTCTTCGAGWVGRIGETCAWCVARLDEPRTSKLRLAPPPINGDSDYEPPPDSTEWDDDPDTILRGMLIDWPVFWAHDHADAEWIAEPVLPAGRSVALFAPGGTGKSLLALWLAAHLAAGRDPFSGRPQPAIDVLYLDYEMTEADLSERLEQMGFGPDHDLTHLHYALLPSLPGLDQPEGGQAVVRLANLVGARLVIIDTFGRAVHGDENDADTVRAWYRWTGLHLKHEGRAFLRVDHAGKDLAKGQRGTSAKNDDVDVVWQMTTRDNGFKLSARKRRMGWVPLEVEITMSDEPLAFALLHGVTWPAGTKEMAQALDELDVPADLPYRKAAKVLREAGQGAREAIVRAAQKYRRERSPLLHFVGDEPPERVTIDAARKSGPHAAENGPAAPSAAPPPTDLFGQVTDLGRSVGRIGPQPSSSQTERAAHVVGRTAGRTQPDLDEEF